MIRHRYEGDNDVRMIYVGFAEKVVVHNDANAKMLLKKSFNMVVMETEVKGMPS